MPPSSTIARLQQAVVFILGAAALTWLVLVWGRSPAWAVVGAVVIACLHAPVLAIEFVLLRWASRDDPAPPARLGQLVSAWLQETLQALRVFGWRQPFAWRSVPDRPEAGPGRGIVFVHGFVCNRGFWTPWLHEARRRGHPYIAVNLEPVFGSIDDYASVIDHAVRRLTEATGRAPVLVCHSMGGLAARAWLRVCGDPARVAHIVTIGTPHRGTWLARFGRRTNAMQMRVGGPWLALLSQGRPPAPGQFTCWYSNADNIVFPPSMATLDGADNRLVPGAAHVDMAFRPRLMQDTFALLAAL